MSNPNEQGSELKWLQDISQPWRALVQVSIAVIVGYYIVMVPSVLAGTDPSCLKTPDLVATFCVPLFVICLFEVLTRRVLMTGLIISGLALTATTLVALHGAGPVWPWVVYVVQNTCLPLACTLILLGLQKASG